MVDVTINDPGALQRGHLDSSKCLGEYGLDGKRLKFISLSLPEECRKYYVGYNLMLPRVARGPHGSLMAGFETVPRLYNLTEQNQFDLTHLPATNDSFFVAFRSYLLTHFHPNSMPWDSLYQFKPYWLNNFNADKEGNIFSTSIIRTSIVPWRTNHVIQQYDSVGHWKWERVFADDEAHAYQFVMYSKEINRVIAIGIENKLVWKAHIYPVN